MADTKILLRVGAEAGAVGNIEVIEREAAKGVGVVALRHHHGGDGRRIVLRIATHDLETPGAHRPARRLGEPVVAGGTPLLAPPAPAVRTPPPTPPPLCGPAACGRGRLVSC